MFVDRPRPGIGTGIKGKATPLTPVFLYMKTPDESLLIDIKGEQTVEPGRAYEDGPVLTADLVAVFEIAIAPGLLHLESAVIAE